MAGATRDMNLSFQAAETALRAAETFIESNANDSFIDTTIEANGLYNEQDNEFVLLDSQPPEDLFTIDWNAKSAEIDGELEGVTLRPRYMIKKLEEKIRHATVFRVTVRGTGGTNNRATLLRSHYAKAFDADSAGPVGRLSWEQLFPSQ